MRTNVETKKKANGICMRLKFIDMSRVRERVLPIASISYASSVKPAVDNRGETPKKGRKPHCIGQS